MARMDAVAAMVAPVFLIRQGPANCWASWCRAEAGFGGAGFCGAACGVDCAGASTCERTASGPGESAACAAAEWLAARVSARTRPKSSGRKRKRRGQPVRERLSRFEIVILSKPRPAKRRTSSVKLVFLSTGALRPKAPDHETQHRENRSPLNSPRAHQCLAF